MADSRFEFLVLGPLLALRDGEPVEIAKPKERELLLVLLSSAGISMSRDALIEAIWPRAEQDRKNALSVHMSGLRKALDPDPDHRFDVIRTDPAGYRADVHSSKVDSGRFLSAVNDASRLLAASDSTGALHVVQEGLRLWRGDPYAEMYYAEALQPEIKRLEEFRSAARELHIECLVASQAYGEAAAEARSAIELDPLRERLRALLMISLLLDQRQADALRAYQDTRESFGESGLEPSDELRDLEDKIFNRDSNLDAWMPISAPTVVQEAAGGSGYFDLASTLGIPAPLGTTARFQWVGRTVELAGLRARWSEIVAGSAASDAQPGRRRIVHLGGEPGIGKTRLLSEFAAQTVEPGGGVILYGRCDEHLQHPYGPFVEALVRYLEAVAPSDRTLGFDPAGLALIAPRVRDLLDDPAPGPAYDRETERHRLFEAMAGWFSALTSQAPVLMVIDDVTWADRGTIQLLRHLTGALADLPIMLAVTHRPGESSGHVETWLADTLPFSSIWNLDGLNPDEVRQLMDEYFVGDMSPSVVAAITSWAERVGGNPLFIGEIMADVRERGMDGDEGDVGDEEVPVPVAIARVIDRRVERLDAHSAQDLLRSAAVIGPVFSIDHVRLLGDLRDDRVLANAVDSAVAAQLIEPKLDVPRTYTFAHAVIRDVIYAGLGDLRRQSEHSRFARLLAQADDSDEWIELLAYHFGQSGHPADRTQAVRFNRRAARRAARQTAHENAVAYLETARALLPSSDLSGDRHDRTLGNVLIELGRAQGHAGADSKLTLREARRIAIRLSDGALYADAVLATSRGVFSAAGRVHARAEHLRTARDLLDRELAASETSERRPRRRAELEARLARVLAHLSSEMTFSDRAEEARNLSDEAVQLANDLDDTRLQVDVLTERMVALWNPNTVQERVALGEELEKLYRAAGEDRPGTLLKIATHYFQAAMEAGEFEKAEELLQTVDTTSQMLRQPVTMGYAALRLSHQACLHGDFEAAEKLAFEAYRLCAPAGNEDAEAFYEGQIFNIRLFQGRLAEVKEQVVATAEHKRNEGIVAFSAAAGLCLGQAAASTDGAERQAELERCEAMLAKVDERLDTLRLDLNWLPCLALSVLAARYLEGSELADRLVGRIRTKLQPYRDIYVDNGSTFFGAVELYVAMAACAAGDEAEAIDGFRVALAGHERLGSGPLIALTQVELADALSRRGADGDEEEALKRLEHARHTAAELGLAEIGRRSDLLVAATAGGSDAQ